MSAFLDRTLQILKWPMAIGFLAVLPGAVMACAGLVGRVAGDPGPLVPFLIGLIGYLLAWWFFLRRPSWGSVVSTFEHELTHAIFAWLTFHRVVGLRASWRGGGETRFRGRGNWLITVAPYFFPTLSVFVVVVLILMPDDFLAWTSGLLGVTVCYHVTSTWLETHRRQPDLQRVSFPFALAFLPSANLIAYGVIIAFAHGGLAELGAFLGALGDHTAGCFTWVGRQIV